MNICQLGINVIQWLSRPKMFQISGSTTVKLKKWQCVLSFNHIECIGLMRLLYDCNALPICIYFEFLLKGLRGQIFKLFPTKNYIGLWLVNQLSQPIRGQSSGGKELIIQKRILFLSSLLLYAQQFIDKKNNAGNIQKISDNFM